MLGLRKENFSVQGMTCKHCEARVNNSLKVLDGILAVRASFEKDTVVVSLKPGATLERTTIESSIRQAGFQVGEAL